MNPCHYNGPTSQMLIFATAWLTSTISDRNYHWQTRTEWNIQIYLKSNIQILHRTGPYQPSTNTQVAIAKFKMHFSKLITREKT